MKSIRTLFGMIILTAILTQSIPAADNDTIIRHPDPETPLQKRWDWAKQEIQNQSFTKGAWIGYSIEKWMGKRSVMGCWSENRKDEMTLSEILTGKKAADDPFWYPESQTIEEAVQDALDQIDNKDKPEEKILKEIALLFRYSNSNQLEKIYFGNLSITIDLENLPLIWLGKADKHESIKLLTKLYKKHPAKT